MKAIDADIVEDGVLVSFSDGSAALFNPEFLYAHRANGSNVLLPKEDADGVTPPH